MCTLASAHPHDPQRRGEDDLEYAREGVAKVPEILCQALVRRVQGRRPQQASAAAVLMLRRKAQPPAPPAMTLRAS